MGGAKILYRIQKCVREIMKTQSMDTSIKAEQVQIELLRKASITERVALASSLTQTTFYLAQQAIKEANPDKSEEELKLLFVAIHYGQELADRLQDFYKNRK
jgi:lipoprotein NlpI